MRVKDIPKEAVLVQDSQDRIAVLESVGLAHLVGEYPTLFVEVGDAEYQRIWGLQRVVPYLEEEVDLLWEVEE
jgi:hypothetical protein